MTFSPKGKNLSIVATGGTATIVDASTGKTIRRILAWKGRPKEAGTPELTV